MALAICVRQMMASFCIGLQGRFAKIFGRPLTKSLRIDVPIYAENEAAEAINPCSTVHVPKYPKSDDITWITSRSFRPCCASMSAMSAMSAMFQICFARRWWCVRMGSNHWKLFAQWAHRISWNIMEFLEFLRNGRVKLMTSKCWKHV